MNTYSEPAAVKVRTFTLREGEGIRVGDDNCPCHEVVIIAIADGHVRLRFSGEANSRIGKANQTFGLGAATFSVDAFGRSGSRNVVITIRANKEVPIKLLQAA